MKFIGIRCDDTTRLSNMFCQGIGGGKQLQLQHISINMDQMQVNLEISFGSVCTMIYGLASVV